MSTPNADQSTFWDEIAPGWVESERHTELVSERFGVAAMDALELQAGQRVVDIGCGSGLTTFALARRVGPGGEAVGLDISSGMIAAAREHPAAIPQARFATADAQSDTPAGTPFDAAFSRFGVMFFADPPAAFTNIRSWLAPGAPFAFACWTDVFANEWMFLAGAAVVSVTGAPPPMPGSDEPGPLSLERDDHVHSLLAEAGFCEITVTRRTETISFPAAEIDGIVATTSRVGPVREALRTADATTAAQITRRCAPRSPSGSKPTSSGSGRRRSSYAPGPNPAVGGRRLLGASRR